MNAIFVRNAVPVLLLGLACVPVRAQFSWTGCKDIANAEFRQESIATRAADTVAEPMKMAFDLIAAPGEDAKGKVDVYFTERLGKVRKFDAKTGKVITLAKFTLNINAGNSSDGVLGIALDPLFRTNHFVFIYYTFVSGAEKSWRVSRFALNAAHDKLDISSEVAVLKIPIKSGSYHPGGALQFDAYGDLWITTGNDHVDGQDFPLYSSPNTNDLRGKILRIHPTPDGKYTIPENNLFKPGTEKTRPEIYIMGTRNPYTLSLDPVRRWAVFGDVGPDFRNMDGGAMNSGGPEKTEEYDLARAAGNYGYPFFAGDFATKPGANPAAPTMPAGYNWDGYAAGLTTLPPAVAPIHPYRKACAITGPIYRYDGDLNSSVKFPPHFTRKWLVTDFNGDNNKLTAFTLDSAGTRILSQSQVLSTIPLHSPLDLQFGPDGALYVNNYSGYRSVTANTGIIRIEYSGDCRPAEPKLEKPITTITQATVPGAAGPGLEIRAGRSLSVGITTAGEFTLEIRDLLGRPLASRIGRGNARLAIDELRGPGIHLFTVKAPEGRLTRKIALP